MRPISTIIIRTPKVIVQRGDPKCRCGNDKDDGRHLPVEECFGGGWTTQLPCPDESAHHQFRPSTWRSRFRRWDSWKDSYL